MLEKIVIYIHPEFIAGVDISKKHPLPLKPEGDPSFRYPLFEYKNPESCNELLSFVHVGRRLVCTADFDSVAWDSIETYIYGSSTSSMSSWSMEYTGPEIEIDICK